LALRPFIRLVKPGIVFGNLISAAGGFLLAARGQIDPRLFVAMAAGIALVVAGGCVFNNIVDRDIDAKMRRTRTRPMVLGEIAPAVAFLFGTALTLAGLALLAGAANLLAALLAAGGWAIYVGLYSLWLKRSSPHGTLVGSLSGAVPPIVGYCAVSGRLDAGAGLLFLMFALWQMPHSYAIAIFRFEDYAAAGIPVQPVRLGVAAARRHIIYYIIAFTLAAALLSLVGYTGYAYLAVAALSGIYWLATAVSGYRALDERLWARRVFACSIWSIMALSLAMAFDFHAWAF
jgi:protoheme IX farnesyltransferase